MSTSLLMGGVAFLFALLIARPIIELLRRYGVGKRIRMDLPQGHQIKMGTPTMGGLIFILPVLMLTAVMFGYSRVMSRVVTGWVENFGGVVLVGRSMLLPLSILVLFAIFGAIDDYMGVKGVRRGEGMRGRTKAMVQLAIATVAALVMNFGFDINRVGLPGRADPIELGLWWIPIAIFIIHGSANAFNLTDGLDGLAALITFLCFAAYGVIAYLQGQVFLTMLCMVMCGALLGFLWFNVHPAQVIMGGLGSEALGATLGVVALMTGQWLLFPIIAIVPVANALAVMAQVSYYKATKNAEGVGKRLFKMAPLHHHFELIGWSETQVVQRFWLIGIIAAMVGVGLAVFGN